MFRWSFRRGSAEEGSRRVKEAIDKDRTEIEDSKPPSPEAVEEESKKEGPEIQEQVSKPDEEIKE